MLFASGKKDMCITRRLQVCQQIIQAMDNNALQSQQSGPATSVNSDLIDASALACVYARQCQTGPAGL
jgi:hypothetical protein